jgi:hypothetical protein
MDFIGLAFLNKGLKALVDYLLSLRSLLAFRVYVKSFAGRVAKLLNFHKQDIASRRRKPGRCERIRVNRIRRGSALRTVFAPIFRLAAPAVCRRYLATVC